MVCKDFKSNHFDDLMTKLNKERKESDKNCDVMINAGSGNFPAHMCIIGGISIFFEKMFTTNMKEKYEKKANIPSVSSETMEVILNFMYTCNITITSENVYNLVEAADYMDIPNLKNYCEEFLLGEIKLDNCFFLRTFAKKYNYEVVVAKANTIIRKDFEALVKDGQFDKLNFEDLLELLQSEDKQVSEKVVYHAVVKWVRNNISIHHSHFNCLFSAIKLEKLSGTFLRDVVMNEKLVMESIECTKKIIVSLLPHVASSSQPSGYKARGFLAIKEKQAFIYDVAKKQLFEIEKTRSNHYGGSVVKFKEKVYAVGGMDSKSVSEISLNDWTRNWSVVSSTNVKRDWNSSAISDGYLYCVGGQSPITSSGERYCFRDNKWSKLSKDMNQTRSCHALVVLEGKLFAFGGYARNIKSFEGNGLNSMEFLNTNNDDSWTMLTPMKEKRFGLAGVVLEDNIYAIGGDNGSSNLSSVEKYDPVLQTWTDVASLNQPRSLHGSCIINNKIYVAGGNSNIIEVYDPEKNIWEIEATFDDLKGACSIVAV